MHAGLAEDGVRHLGEVVGHVVDPVGAGAERALAVLHHAMDLGLGEQFAELGLKAAFADGALDRKTKELIALAIGVVEGCDGCIASHGQAAARAGATPQEAAEAIGVTFLMHGGPATIHGARAFDAFCEFVDAIDSGEPAV